MKIRLNEAYGPNDVLSDRAMSCVDNGGAKVLYPTEKGDYSYGAYIFKHGINYGFVSGDSDFDRGQVLKTTRFNECIYFEEDELDYYVDELANATKMLGQFSSTSKDISTFTIVVCPVNEIPALGPR